MKQANQILTLGDGEQQNDSQDRFIIISLEFGGVIHPHLECNHYIPCLLLALEDDKILSALKLTAAM